MSREEYVGVVGFGREPSVERRRWLGRFILLLFVLLLVWLFWTRVINPPSDSGPGPVRNENIIPNPD